MKLIKKLTPQQQLDKAQTVAQRAHAGQTRRDGTTPYMVHVQAVVDGVDGIEEKTVAYLHDVVEDTEVTLSELALQGFSSRIIKAVNLLTKQDGYNHKNYRQGIKGDKLASKVKIADMRANLADTPTRRQIERYTADIEYLST